MKRQIGERLRHYRKQAGLSQEEAGIRASLHRTEIGLLERGERLPRVDTLIKLAGALGVSAGELLEGITWQPGQLHRGGFDLPEKASSQDRSGTSVR